MKKEKGSVAIYIFVAVITVILVLTAILVNYSSKRKSQLIETKQLQNIYDGNMTDIYNSIVTPIKITYNANGGSGTMQNTQGDYVNIAQNTFTAPAGKRFVEWNTKADGTGVSYRENETVNEDLNLYAIWDLNMIKIKSALTNSTQSLSTLYGNAVSSSVFTSNEGNDWTWQLFYDDSDYIFLIASDYVPNSKLPMNGNTGFGTTDLLKRSGVNANYNASFCSNNNHNDYVLSAGTIYNAGSASTAITNNRLTQRYLKWVAAYPTASNDNIQATAFMMDTNKWSAFAGNKYISAEAIGGPTLDLFVDSYNSYYLNLNKLRTIDTINSSNSTNVGYILYDNNSQTIYNLNEETNMWVITETDKARAFWFASPASNWRN